MSNADFVMYSPDRPATLHGGFYSYTCWPRGIPAALARLYRDWECIDAATGDDIYLLTPISDVCVVRLAGGRQLEIRERGRDRGLLQHWRTARSVRFPMCPDALLDLATALGLREMPPNDAALSPAHLVAALSALPDPVRSLTVHTSRLVFRRGTCRAEVASLDPGRGRQFCLSLEAGDEGSILGAIAGLGLTGHRNISTGEALRPPQLEQPGTAAG